MSWRGVETNMRKGRPTKQRESSPRGVHAKKMHSARLQPGEVRKVVSYSRTKPIGK